MHVPLSTAHKTKIPKNEDVSCYKSLRYCIYHAKNVKMPTIVGILTFNNVWHFNIYEQDIFRAELSCRACKRFITSGPVRCRCAYC